MTLLSPLSRTGPEASVPSQVESEQAAFARRVDRECLARDLSGTVIRELFAIGMSLQSVASQAESSVHREELARLVDGLDHVIAGIRSAVLDFSTDLDVR